MSKAMLRILVILSALFVSLNVAGAANSYPNSTHPHHRSIFCRRA